MSTEIITNLNSLCSSCGYFDSESVLNNGYGCKHKDCGDGEFLDSKGNYVEYYDWLIAESLTKRKVTINRRLAKKFIKIVRKMTWNQKIESLKKIGIKFYGKCFSFSCPISYEVSFDSISHYENGKDYDYIESEEEMPLGWGDDLMALEKTEADKLGIIY